MIVICGISAYIQGINHEDKNPVDEATSMIQRLVYRGYDSWGYSTDNYYTHKETGEVPAKIQASNAAESDACISHTRWATHGKVTKENAHPHESCDGRFAVVHNGVIENHEELKQELGGDHVYTSETDTEYIPHFLEQELKENNDKDVLDSEIITESLQEFDEKAEGTYAAVILDREDRMLYGLKRGSPLVFTIPSTHKKGDNQEYPKGAYFASDLYAISDKASDAYFMEDGDLVMTSGNNFAVWNNGELYDSPFGDKFQEFEWTEEEPVLGDDNKYWMEKEIKEIPDALNRLQESLENEQRETLEKFKEKIRDSDKVLFTASGTSYHATLLAVYYLNRQGVDAQTLIASEFENYQRITDNTTVIAVSQSGETRDVLDAVSVAREKDAEVLSLVNVPHSTLQRESDLSLEIKAGQENCVAATKTFTNQVHLLKALAQDPAPPPELHIETIEENARNKAEKYFHQGHEDLYIIGKSETYPLAREIALKLKEISYIHAEGMMAGELKHGTLALIEEDTPVIALNKDGELDTSIEEVLARGGEVTELSDDLYTSVIYGFFLAMHWADLKKLPVDKPRNLAKSVTVK